MYAPLTRSDYYEDSVTISDIQRLSHSRFFRLSDLGNPHLAAK